MTQCCKNVLSVNVDQVKVIGINFLEDKMISQKHLEFN